MSVVTGHVRVQLTELIRIPAFIVSTLALPALLFASFAIPVADTVRTANQVVASYCAFALIGAVLFDFGVNVAVDREITWRSSCAPCRSRRVSVW